MGRGRISVIGELIERYALKTGAEIGVGTGPTTDALLKRFPRLEWIAVDNFPAGFDLSDGGKMTEARQREVRRVYGQKISKYAPRLRHIDLPSEKAAERIEDGSLDIVFIDADHTYEACKADIIAWRPKVRPGGWLTGHDYWNTCFPGVAQAVEEMVPGFSAGADYTWFVQVPE